MDRIVAAASIGMDPGDQPTMGFDYGLAPSRVIYAKQGTRLGFGLRTL